MKKLLKNLALGLLVVCSTGVVSGQQGIVWQKTIGGNIMDVSYSTQQTADGGYICGGTSYSNASGDKTENLHGGLHTDYWVVKLDANGQIQWQKDIGGNYNDELQSIQQTTDGGYICGGSSSSPISGDKTENSHGLEDYWVVKLSANGQIQWQKTIGGSSFDYLNSIQQTADGGYICGGTSRSDSSGNKIGPNVGLEDYWVVKLDANGQIQWQKTIGGFTSDYLNSIQQTADGGYICGGSSNSPISGNKTENNKGLIDYWVVKLDMNGQILWQKAIGGSNGDLLNSIQQTTDGGYICGGNSGSPISGDKTENNKGDYDYWVVKLNTNGQIQWQKTIGGNGFDELNSIHQTVDGGYICGGTSSSPISGDKTENNKGGYDYWVVKLNTIGQIKWQKTIGGNNDEYLTSIQQTIDGNYICGGSSYSNISGDKTENSYGENDYWILKINNPKYQISGNVYIDANQDCDSIGESAWGNRSVMAKHNSNTAFNCYATTDSLGNYNMYVWDDGTYNVNANMPWFAGNPSCFTGNSVTLNATTPNVSGINIPVIITHNCPSMNVSTSTLWLRRCFNNTYFVNYKNEGFAVANNAYVEVQLPTEMSLVSSSIPNTNLGNGLIRFNLGNVAGETQGQFTYIIYLACGDSTILGQTHCVEAHIYPDSACIPVPSAANITVQSQCTGDSIQFKIINNSNTGTTQPINYYVVEDEILQLTAPIQLTPNQTVTVTIPNNHVSTYRLEIANPMASMPNGRLWGPAVSSASVEGCGATTTFHTGFVTQRSMPDDQPWLDIDCQQNRGSFDPNDKSAVPAGIGATHDITANDAIEYKIRFQNTGTDTAFTVVVRDTLDSHLDPATIQFGVSSHAYTPMLNGNGVLTFMFTNIQLPDSNANEPASHGFVTYKIWQKPNNSVGTQIHNTANIYFDYNVPVITNTTTHTINNFNRAVVSIEEGAVLDKNINLTVYPNPFETNATFDFNGKELNNVQFNVYDLSGRSVHSQNYKTASKFTFERGNLNEGIYMYQLYSMGKLINSGKVIVR